LEGLSGNLKIDMEAKGFEECKSILSFTRYVRERQDIGLEAFVRDLMGENDFNEYQYMSI